MQHAELIAVQKSVGSTPCGRSHWSQKKLNKKTSQRFRIHTRKPYTLAMSRGITVGYPFRYSWLTQQNTPFARKGQRGGLDSHTQQASGTRSHRSPSKAPQPHWVRLLLSVSGVVHNSLRPEPHRCEPLGEDKQRQLRCNSNLADNMRKSGSGPHHCRTQNAPTPPQQVGALSGCPQSTTSSGCLF